MIDSRDNSTPTQHNQFKRGPIFDTVTDRFRTVLHPSKWRALDESLVAWRGNLSFRQYISSKRARFEIKLFMLCDAATGYIPRMKIYIGDKDAPARAADGWASPTWPLPIHGQLLQLPHPH